ncbi:M16 family metallopeptidase [Vibrio sp.]|uniref:M16 family metallopeptidase n=1 Tax=Vibrio sp. TaxID=678 RepID=UPI003D0E4F26
MRQLLIVITTCLFFLGCQQAPQPIDTPLKERSDLIRGQLPNGLQYILVKNARPENRVSLQLVVHAGSLDEEDDQKGIAHLVEHMAFNGTQHYPANTLIEHQEKLGMVFGRDVNAMTEYYTTSYFLHLPDNTESMMNEGFHMLAQQASALVFDPDELEKERPVVVEEWRSGLSMMSRLGKANRQILLNHSRFGDREPIGDMDLVRHVDASRIKAFWQDWYHPNNMTLIVVGATEQAQVEAMLARHFAKLAPQTLPKRPDLRVPLDNQLKLETITDSEITTEVLSLNFRQQAKEPRTESELRAQLLNELTMQALNKRLSEQYQIESQHISKMMAMARPLATGYRNNRLMALLTTDDYQSSVQEMFGQLSRFAEHGISQSDLDTVRYSLISRYQQMADSLRDTTNRRVMMSVFNRLRTQSPLVDNHQYAEQVELLANSILVSEINQHLAQMVHTQQPIVIAQIHPDSLDKLPSEQRLNQAWTVAKANPPAATEVVTVRSQLMASPPKPAKIISHREESGVHVWELDNGSQVWFEASEETANQLLIEYRGWGGTAHLPNALRRPAMQLRQMGRFGYAGLNSQQLKMLNAPYANKIMTFVNQDSHGFIGSSDVNSLENWLQNIHLQITQPQVDEALWQSSKLLIERGIENRLTSAHGQFNSAIDAIRYQHNPELQALSLDELHQISTDDLLTAWQQLFASAAGHQLVIVGNAEPEQVIELARRYIGSLPSSTRRYFPVPLPPLAEGRHQIRIAAGEEPMAVTSLLFNQPMKYRLEQADQAYLLSRIISNRLRESLREDAGGVYSVRFAIRFDRHRNQAFGMISYSHEPQRSQELKDQVLAEIESLKTHGVTKKELQRVIHQTKQALVADNLSDRQRIAYLKSAARYGESLTAVEDYLSWIDGVEPESLTALAQTIFSTSNWIDALLVPANDSDIESSI